MSFLSTLAGSSERKLPAGPSAEGSADDAEKQAQQRARQTGSPNADWPAQRRYYDKVINRALGLPIAPPQAFRGKDEEED